MDIDKIKNIIALRLGVEVSAITNETSFMEDLGADSLDTVELVMAFEDELGVEIDDDSAEKIKTLQDLIDFLKSKGM